MTTESKNAKYLLIKLLQIDIKPADPSLIFQQHSAYYSFRINDNETMHFSSCMPNNSAALSDDIIVCVQNANNLHILYLHRWENHMIIYTHELDISQLKTRSTTMKKIQTKSGQTLKMLIQGLSQEELKFGIKFVQSITQHYLLIDQIHPILKQNSAQSHGPSFFKICTSNSSYILPVVNGRALIKLPQTLQFFRIKNGVEVSKSKQYSHQQLKDHETIVQLSSINGSKLNGNIKMKLKWGINLLQTKSQNVLLLDSHQIMVYDIEVKFDNYNEYGNSKVKFVYGNKSFEIGSDFNSAKPAKIKKIINLIIKSEDQQIYVLVQKNLKVIAQTKFQIQQIVPLSVYLLKKKIIDSSSKSIGIIKFKCQKGKNLSTPTNNKAWRESIKNKNNPGLITYILDQMSVRYTQQKRTVLQIKTELQEKMIKNLPNIEHYDEDNEVKSSPLYLALKYEESIYLILKHFQSQNNKQESDFIGIALFNPTTCRLGQTCTQVKFFKNQAHTATLNLIGNKIVGYPLIRPTFQPQLLQSLTHRTLSLSVIMRQVYFSPFFYTYRYENKNQVYSIVEINKLKKVLILENKNKSNQLAFNCSASSDNLDFSIEQVEVIRMKITFLVSDIGQDQEVYGYTLIKIRANELQQSGTGLKFYLIEIKNDFGSIVGQINVQVHKAALFNSYEKQSRDVLQSGAKAVQNDKRRAKMHLSQISQSVQFKQKSSQIINNQQLKSINLKKKSYDADVKMPQTSSRYGKKGASLTGQRRQRNNSVIGVQESIKLPSIKQDALREQNYSPLKDRKSHNQFVQMMKIRKRSVKGHYQQNSMLQSYQMRNYLNLRGSSKNQNQQLPQTFHLKEKIQKQNPNLERNMQILFPKKNGRLEKNTSSKPTINEQQQKLKGLKSVLYQISADMKQIEPTVKDYGRNKVQSRRSQLIQQNVPGFKNEDQHLQGPEWDDNQFAL